MIGVASACLSIVAVALYSLFTIVTFTMPIRYIIPFEVENRFYNAGGTLLVTVEYCLSRDIPEYNITQYFVEEDTGTQYFTEPIKDVVLLRSSIKTKQDAYYTEKDGTPSDSPNAYWFCRKAKEVPKKIPHNVPDGTYRIYFDGSLNSFFGMKKTIRYWSEPFIIKSNKLSVTPDLTSVPFTFDESTQG